MPTITMIFRSIDYYGTFAYADQWIQAALEQNKTHLSEDNADFSIMSEDYHAGLGTYCDVVYCYIIVTAFDSASTPSNALLLSVQMFIIK